VSGSNVFVLERHRDDWRVHQRRRGR
jgi:hypothetical protein